MLGYRTDRRIESVGEMTEDYKNSYFYDRLRERWGSMSADKRAEAIRRLVEVRVNPAGRGTKILIRLRLSSLGSSPMWGHL